VPTIIDELIVLFKIDGSQAKKAADASTATVQKVTKTAKISAEDQERIANSQEQRRREREKRDAKVAAQREKDEKKQVNESAKRAEEYGDKVKGIALGLSGAFLGFESIKGAVAAFNNIATATAQIGRRSEDLGQSVHDVQTWELAVKKAGGTAEDADATFSALSQTFTGAMLRGESSPFLQLLQQMGVAARDAKGEIRPLSAVLLELGDHMQARGLSRANAFNLFTGAGGSAGVFDLLYDKNRNKFLNESSLQANIDQPKVTRAQAFQDRKENFKQKVGAGLSNLEDNILQMLDGSFHANMTDGQFGLTPGTAEYKKFANSPYAGKIMQAEGYNHLPQGLLERLLMQESSLNPDAVNKTTGARGIAQLMPKYFPNAGKDPYADIDTAAEHLSKLIKNNGGDVYKAIAAYNDGQTNLDKHLVRGDVPKETLDYVAKVGNVHGATPDVGGSGASSTTHDNSVQVTTGNVTIVTQATDANGIAEDFTQSMRDRGALLTQTNYGMTP
jgi:hypothetical protein